MSDTFLEGVVVVELGGRLSAGLCGALLQRLGAEVWVVEGPSEEAWPDSRAVHRELLGAGKRRVVRAPQGDEGSKYLEHIVERANVVIISSDRPDGADAELAALTKRVPIVCDVSAFGTSGPLAGEPFSD